MLLISPSLRILSRCLSVLKRLAQNGKEQICLDFITAQRSIVTFRQLQATQRCGAASMPRGGSELVRQINLRRRNSMESDLPEGTMRYNLHSFGAKLQLSLTHRACAKLKKE